MFEEGPPTSEPNFEGISNAQNFDELFLALDNLAMGGLFGSEEKGKRKFYPTEKLKESINLYRNMVREFVKKGLENKDVGERETLKLKSEIAKALNAITRAGDVNLRAIVKKLSKQEIEEIYKQAKPITQV
ncbi:MAG: hypothetical protein AAB786_02300 [Patescibacteria group bacterium]